MAQAIPAPAAKAFNPRSFLRGDTVFAGGLMLMLAMLILPLPPWLLDIGLAFSLTLAVLIMMLSLFMEKPTDFNSFPQILLISTIFRLALNVASTRLILSEGHQGTHAAGHIIEAFGNFLMQGNTVIGIIVFAILLIINFIVITKGSGRIAEVSARFTLDAMPGKQMAIDADLAAGIINDVEAKARRKGLEEEASFYGSMDGAAKFVRGDAIAGLLITFINVVGGIIIGTVFMGISLSEAAHTYTFLTIGDGLVTQIPALIISVASGLLVTKSGVRGSSDKAVFAQLSAFPSAMGLASVMMGGFAFMPGIPTLIFLFFSGLTGGMAYYLAKIQEEAKQVAKKAPSPGTPGAEGATPGSAAASAAEEPMNKVLQIDAMRLELGYGLLPLVNGERGVKLPDQIKTLRRQLAAEMGFVVPSVRIQDNLQLPPNQYVIRIKEIKVGEGSIRPGQLLVLDPKGQPLTLNGEPTTEPTFGLPAMWINDAQRTEAEFKGYTVVEAGTVLVTHLTEIIKENMPEMLSYSETQKLLDQLGDEHKKLVGDVVPDKMNISGLQRVLHNLLKERVSIRDLPTILEGIAEAEPITRNITLIGEHVRQKMTRSLCEMYAGEDGIVPLVTLSPEWEQTLTDALIGNGDDKQLALAPSKMQDFASKVRQVFEKHAAEGETPVLITPPGLRPYVRAVIERFRPATPVLSQAEIHARARIRTVGVV
ncbi:MAG: flagellar biosynthesis protein FlhA [Holosporales bacterium]|jgi:flagellar biosynthesis protein FlhA